MVGGNQGKKKLPMEIQRKYLGKKGNSQEMLNNTLCGGIPKIPPANRLEKLSGKLKVLRYSI